MPEGQDKIFDELLDKLDLQAPWHASNRSSGSSKQDKASFAPQFRSWSKETDDEYRLCIERYTVEKVVLYYTAEIATFKFQPETTPSRSVTTFFRLPFSSYEDSCVRDTLGDDRATATTLAGTTSWTAGEKSMQDWTSPCRDSVLVLNKFAREEVDMSGCAILSRTTLLSQQISLVGCIACLVKEVEKKPCGGVNARLFLFSISNRMMYVSYSGRLNGYSVLCFWVAGRLNKTEKRPSSSWWLRSSRVCVCNSLSVVQAKLHRLQSLMTHARRFRIRGLTRSGKHGLLLCRC
jgi:hypothetical protein